MPTTLTELGSDHHTRRNQRARLFEGPDADETTVSYISDGMVIIEHLSARTGDIIRTCKNFTFSTVKSTHRRPSQRATPYKG